MSHCINDLHLQEPPFTLRQASGGWQATCCECRRLSPVYERISGALLAQGVHAGSHRLCAA